MASKSNDQDNGNVTDPNTNKTMSAQLIISPGSEFVTDVVPIHRPSIDLNHQATSENQ